jgi:hypothetical protein
VEFGKILKENGAVCCETEKDANIMLGFGGSAAVRTSISPIDVKLEGEKNAAVV